jgi:hypothetical protein
MNATYRTLKFRMFHQVQAMLRSLKRSACSCLKRDLFEFNVAIDR